MNKHFAMETGSYADPHLTVRMQLPYFTQTDAYMVRVTLEVLC